MAASPDRPSIRLRCMVSVLLLLLPLMPVPLPFDTRLVAFVPLVSPSRISLRESAVGTYQFLLTALSAVTLIWSEDPVATFQTVVGGLAVWLLVSVPSPRLMGALHRTLAFGSVGLSMLAIGGWLAGLAELPNGRLAWPMENANSLALAIVIAGSALVAGKEFRWLLVAILVAGVYLTGSRNGLSALVFSVALRVVLDLSVRHRLLLKASAIAAVIVAPLMVLLLEASVAGSNSVFRLNDSRSGNWSVLIDEINTSNWFTGVGAGAFPGLASNSLLSGVVEFGPLLGLVLLVSLVALVRRSLFLAPSLAPAFLALGLTGSFEGWWFAAGSPFLALALLVIGSSQIAEIASSSSGSKEEPGSVVDTNSSRVMFR